MAYQSRRRKFLLRHERYRRDKRNVKVIALFALIALAAYIFFNRVSIYDWLRTYFM